MADYDDETPWYHSLAVGAGVMLGVALLVGAVISLVALGAVSITGLGSSSGEADARPSLYIPDRSGGSEEPEDEEGLTLADLNDGEDPRETESARPEKSPSPTEKKRTRPRSTITLSASPLQVSPMERIYLTGTYPRGGGASLQVQRAQGGSGWSDFPTSTSVSGGTFSTYVMTGRSGPNKFRMLDPATGKKSNIVTVRVR